MGEARTTALSVQSVGKRYGPFTALHPISLEVQAGECLGVMGANGAGKSTLLQIISGVIAPSQGTVWLNGKNITAAPLYQRARWGMGWVAQRNQGFAQLTVADNLRCALNAQKAHGISSFFYRQRTSQSTAELERLLHGFGLTAWREHPVVTVPYGTQRVLELAMTLAGQPEVVVLDEPCTGLNPAEVDQLMVLLRRHCAGKTVVLVEHDVSVVLALAHRIAVLDQGHLIACESPAAVRVNPAVQAAYLGSLHGL